MTYFQFACSELVSGMNVVQLIHVSITFSKWKLSDLNYREKN